METIGIIGVVYENRRNGQRGVLTERDEQARTLTLFDGKTGSFFPVSYGAFRSNWRKASGADTIPEDTAVTEPEQSTADEPEDTVEEEAQEPEATEPEPEAEEPAEEPDATQDADAAPESEPKSEPEKKKKRTPAKKTGGGQEEAPKPREEGLHLVCESAVTKDGILVLGLMDGLLYMLPDVYSFSNIAKYCNLNSMHVVKANYHLYISLQPEPDVSFEKIAEAAKSAINELNLYGYTEEGEDSD